MTSERNSDCGVSLGIQLASLYANLSFRNRRQVVRILVYNNTIDVWRSFFIV
jgi:hypothetical protein